MSQPIRRTSPYLINEEPLQIMPTIACVFGVDEAIFIQRLQFWLRNSKHELDGRIWIYNKHAEWHRQMPFFKPRTLQRILTTLRDLGVLITTDKYNRNPSDRTKWYTLDLDVMDSLIEAYLAAQKEAEPEDDDEEDEGIAKTAKPIAKMANRVAKMAKPIAKMAHSNIEQTDQLQTDQLHKGGASAPLASAAPPAAPDPFADTVSEPQPTKPSDHPAVQLYRALHERFPTKAQMKIIAKKDPPLDNWDVAIHTWAERGFNITDISGQLEWAFDPTLMHRRRPNKSKGIQSNGETSYNPGNAEEIEEMRRWAEENYPKEE